MEIVVTKVRSRFIRTSTVHYTRLTQLKELSEHRYINIYSIFSMSISKRIQWRVPSSSFYIVHQFFRAELNSTGCKIGSWSWSLWAWSWSFWAGSCLIWAGSCSIYEQVHVQYEQVHVQYEHGFMFIMSRFMFNMSRFMFNMSRFMIIMSRFMIIMSRFIFIMSRIRNFAGKIMTSMSRPWSLLAENHDHYEQKIIIIITIIFRKIMTIICRESWSLCAESWSLFI